MSEDGCYYLLALDSWGDGWNGAEVECTPAIPGFALPFTLFDDSYGFHAFELGDVGCEVVLEGCTEWDALNYVQGANTDDGSCLYAQTFESVVNGVSTTREYIYHAPEGMAENAPLVFVLHGYFGTAEGMYDISGFRELADQEGFGVVGHKGCLTATATTTGTPILIGGRDRRRVFGPARPTSPSGAQPRRRLHVQLRVFQRGYMSYSLACRAADTFRGIGPSGER